MHCTPLAWRLLYTPVYVLPVSVQLPAAEQIITAEPDVRDIELQPDDQFLLLACDGIWDVMTKWVMLHRLSNGGARRSLAYFGRGWPDVL